jgi:hypothetical protein
MSGVAADFARRAQVTQPQTPAWTPPPGDPPQQTSGDSPPEPERDSIAIAPVIWTTVIIAVVAAGGHGFLWLASSQGWSIPTDRPDGSKVAAVPWQPVTGIALVIVALVAFGGFFIAARRARVAIAASFLLTFLVALSYVLTLQGLAQATQVGGAKDLFNDFRTVVIVIIGFYFGTEALVAGAKIIGAAITNNDPKMIQRADRDLAPPARGVT